VSTPAVTALSAAFVVVSAASLTVQSVALRRLFAWPPVSTDADNMAYRGLLRTSMCRVLAALTYVTLGAAIWIRRDPLPLPSLAVFTAVQLLWQANAVADVRLRHRLAEAVAKSRQQGAGRA